MKRDFTTLMVSMMTLALVLTLSIPSFAASTRLFSAWQPHQSTPEEILRSAAYEGNTGEVKRLLAQGTPVDARDKEGWTPLMWAQAGEQAEAIELLLARGADINARDHAGFTAVHQAAVAGRTIALRALLTHGAEVESVSRSGYSPLMDAALYGRAVAVELLLAHGADPNFVSVTGHSPVSLAEKGGHRHVAFLLVLNGADPQLQSKRLRAALARVDAPKGPARVQLAGLMRNPEILDDLCEECLSRQTDMRMTLVSAKDSAKDSGQHGKIVDWCRQYAQRKAMAANQHQQEQLRNAGEAQFVARGSRQDAATHLLQQAIDSWEQVQAKYPDANRRLQEMTRKGVPLDKLAGKEPLLQKAMSIWMTLQNEHPDLMRQLMNLAGISR